MSATKYPEVLALALRAGATAYSPPPMRAVRGISMTHEAFDAFIERYNARPQLAAGLAELMRKAREERHTITYSDLQALVEHPTKAAQDLSLEDWKADALVVLTSIRIDLRQTKFGGLLADELERLIRSAPAGTGHAAPEGRCQVCGGPTPCNCNNMENLG